MTHSDPAPRGAADRVARVHHQTRRTLALAAAFALAAPLSALLPRDTGVWLPLHLFLVGGVLSAISGATQMLAVTWSSSPAPPDRTADAQRWSIAAGALAVAIGREAGSDAAVAVGGVLVAAGLGGLAALLVRIRSGAVTDRFAPAIEAYLAALAFGVVGVLLGIDLATRAGADDRDIHVTLNLLGLVGLVIVGTLPFFAATQLRSKMSPRATPARVRAVVAWCAGATVLTAGAHAADADVAAAVGLGAYAVGVLATARLLPPIGAKQIDWAGARIVQLLAGIGWWALTLVVLAVQTAREADDGPALRALAVGGIAQIVAASLGYLAPVLRGGGHQRLSSGFALLRSWPSLAGANVAAVGALLDQGVVLAVGLAVWVTDGAVRGGRFLREGRTS